MTHRLVLAACDFAARAHSPQRRKGEAREPYINHPVEVAMLLAETPAGGDEALLAAALLHDVVEDTHFTEADIRQKFGADVAGLVIEVTDDKDLTWRRRREVQIEQAASRSPRARLIRIADKISNVGGLTVSPPAGWSPAQMRRYVIWAEAVVVQCLPPNAGFSDLTHGATADALTPLFHQAVHRANTTIPDSGET